MSAGTTNAERQLRTQLEAVTVFLRTCSDERAGALLADMDKCDQALDGIAATQAAVADANANMAMLYMELEEAKDEIETRERKLGEALATIQSMLGSLRQGLATLDADLQVGANYSAHLEQVLDQEGLAGQSILELLFEHTTMSADECGMLRASLQMSIGEDPLFFETNEHALPRRVEFNRWEDRRQLELDWSAIVDGDVVVKVLLAVRDVTEIRELEAKAAEQGRRLALLGELVSVPHERFVTWVAESRAISKRLRGFGCMRDSEAATQWLRGLHTIKGSARMHGLCGASEAAHHAEDAVSELLAAEHIPGPDAFWEALADVEQAIETYVDVAVSLLGRDVAHAGDLDGPVSFAQLVEPCSQGAGSLARELGKPTPHFELKGESVLIEPKVARALRAVSPHIIRNAVDHGLESTEARRAAGKPDQGTLAIEARRLDDGSLRIEVSDDGGGLDLEGLRNGAIARGLAAFESATDDCLAELVFESGLSTRGAVTRISGRGVGMDAVRQACRELGGDAQIVFTGERNAEGRRPFAVILSIPVQDAGLAVAA